MPINSAIALGFQPPQLDDPLSAYGRAMQIKAAMEESKVRKLQLDQMEKSIKDEETAREILGRYKTPEEALPELQARLGTGALPIYKQIVETKKMVDQMGDEQRKRVSEIYGTLSQDMDEIAATPSAQRQQVYSIKRQRYADMGLNIQLPEQWDDRMLAYGNIIKQQQREIDAKTQPFKDSKVVEGKIISPEGKVVYESPEKPKDEKSLSQYDQTNENWAQNLFKKSYKETNALEKWQIQEAIRKQDLKDKAASKETPVTPSEGITVDPDSSNLLAQTGMSLGAFAVLTGQTSKLTGRSTVERTQLRNEAQAWGIKHNVDISTIPARYDALMKTTLANSLRNNQAEVAEMELDKTLQNLKEAGDDASFRNIRISNVLKMFAGKEVNDPNVTRYKFHLKQLQREFAMYNAAIEGQIDQNGNIRELNKDDLDRAAEVITDGFAAGSITGFANALENSRRKMKEVLDDSIELQRKRVWELFGVGKNFKGNLSGQQTAQPGQTGEVDEWGQPRRK